MSQKLLNLLETAKTLSEVDQRKVAAILGACVADAAARPLHWIYDMTALNSYLKSGIGGVDRVEKPEFFPENRSPFYSLPTGNNSFYFDIASSVLKSLSESKSYDYKKICQDMERSFFGPDTEYSLEKRQDFLTKKADGNIFPDPMEGKWMSGSLLKFAENYKKGKRPFGDPDIQATDGFCAALPVVLLWSGEPDVFTKAEEMINTLSSWPTATSWGLVCANIMDKFIQGKEDPINEAREEAIERWPAVAQGLSSVDQFLKTDHVDAVGEFGRSCDNPGSPQGAIHSFKTSNDFKEAVRQTLRAGGCDCSRSLFIGAMSGAKYGVDGIPQDWISQTFKSEEVLQLSIKVFEK